MCIQLDILHNTNSFWHEKCSGAANIDFASFQHSDHSAPGAILGAIPPAIRDFKTYSVVKQNTKF